MGEAREAAHGDRALGDDAVAIEDGHDGGGAARATDDGVGADGGAEVTLGSVDCCLFDRVLLFLEAAAAGRAPPAFDIRLWPELARAASALGLRSLADAAAARLGEFDARLREYGLPEIRARNAAGECLLLVDGMVLDVTRWLPEHPGATRRGGLAGGRLDDSARDCACARAGGSTIIPQQATNVDSTTFFGAPACPSPSSARRRRH